MANHLYNREEDLDIVLAYSDEEISDNNHELITDVEDETYEAITLPVLVGIRQTKTSTNLKYLTITAIRKMMKCQENFVKLSPESRTADHSAIPKKIYTPLLSVDEIIDSIPPRKWFL